MLSTTAAQIAEITAGRLVGGATGTEQVTGTARIDSREVAPGDLFAAFDGERVDGHDFIPAARGAGAVIALATRDTGAPAILVEDVVEALSLLATAQLERARQERPDLVVVAITGSAGKTGTKDMLGEVLAQAGPTIAPRGSHNNELGLPLTVLGLDSRTRFLVLEMGARGIGHIAHLTDIARPDISLVLNVGSAHLGEFGSVDAIAEAKGELVAALAPTGRAVLNADDPRVAAMATRSQAPVVTWGQGPADVRAQEIALDDEAHASFTIEVAEGLQALDGTPIPAGSADVVLEHLVGEHQGMNALAVTAAALTAGLSLTDIAATLRHAQPRSGQRMETTQLAEGITLINDAYNANPDSMRLALRTLAHVGRGRRTVAVIGEMRELGEDTIALHDAVGRLAVRLNIGLLISVGEGARAVYDGACLEGSFGGEAVHAGDLDEALAVLETSMRPGDVILLKSSRDAGVRELGPRLIARTTGEATA